jgi:hypothetical protein
MLDVVQVQADTVQVCGFLPTIESVIAAQNGPIYDLGKNALVSFICDAVPISESSRAGQYIVIVVNGVVMHGILTR